MYFALGQFFDIPIWLWFPVFFSKPPFITVFGCLYDASGKAHKFSFHRKVDRRIVRGLNTSWNFCLKVHPRKTYFYLKPFWGCLSVSKSNTFCLKRWKGIIRGRQPYLGLTCTRDNAEFLVNSKLKKWKDFVEACFASSAKYRHICPLQNERGSIMERDIDRIKNWKLVEQIFFRLNGK